jgi:taurine dioxygenase
VKEILPTGGALGAEVRGLDLRQALPASTQAILRDAFFAHSLLLIRGQRLSKDDLVRFSASFGEPIAHPTNTRDRDPECPLITIISNIEEDGRPQDAVCQSQQRAAHRRVG